MIGCFTEKVPKCDVDSANCVSNAAPAAKPEGILMQCFGNPFWFKRSFSEILRSQKLKGGIYERFT